MDVTHAPAYLTDDEIAEICKPLKMPAAQRRHLERLGLIGKTKPNDQPIVARAEFERVFVGAALNAAASPPTTAINMKGLEEWAKSRKLPKRKIK